MAVHDVSAEQQSANDRLDMSHRMLCSPFKSVRRLSQETGVDVSTAEEGTRDEPKLYPCRISAVHKLKPTDISKRVNTAVGSKFTYRKKAKMF
jgi:hypothetical protein